MAGTLPEDFPQDARNYLQTIDLQLASIQNYTYPLSDYEHALADQVAQLRELRRLVIADPSIATIPRPSKRAADTTADRPAKRARRVELATCSTCFEDHPAKDTATLVCCNTNYCKPCFHAWFEASLATKHLPKCCDIGIEPKDCSIKLTRPLLAQYKAVVKTLDAERLLWCSNSACRAFIEIGQDASGFVQCTKCRRKTCASCSGTTTAHVGLKHTCPNHLRDQVLESAIEANEWMRCPRCYVVVEKNKGCNNISCTCGTMFCFKCGVLKTSEAGRCKCSHSNMQFRNSDQEQLVEWGEEENDDIALVN